MTAESQVGDLIVWKTARFLDFYIILWYNKYRNNKKGIIDMKGTHIGYLRGYEVRALDDKRQLEGTKWDDCFYTYDRYLYFRETYMGKINDSGRVILFQEEEFMTLKHQTRPKAVPPKTEITRQDIVKEVIPVKKDDEIDIDKVLRDSRKLTVEDLVGNFNLD